MFCAAAMVMFYKSYEKRRTDRWVQWQQSYLCNHWPENFLSCAAVLTTTDYYANTFWARGSLSSCFSGAIPPLQSNFPDCSGKYDKRDEIWLYCSFSLVQWSRSPTSFAAKYAKLLIAARRSQEWLLPRATHDILVQIKWKKSSLACYVLRMNRWTITWTEGGQAVANKVGQTGWGMKYETLREKINLANTTRK